MFHWRISLNPVLLLLLVNFLSGFKLELMYISLTHLHGFQLPLLLPLFIKIICFVFIIRIKRSLKYCSDRPVIVAKWFLKLPNLHMLIKQKSSSFPVNLALNRGKSVLPPLMT